jgi:hypothetical protein
LLPQDLLHLPAFRRFINELVQVADLPHQRIVHLFDAGGGIVVAPATSAES